MNKNVNIIQIFMEHIKNSCTEDFMRNILFCFAAPTIRGLKASCLINFKRSRDDNMRSSWIAHADEWLSPLGLEWILLSQTHEQNNALVLIYRRESLARVLCCDKACCILKEYGYPLRDIDACLECLRKKFDSCPGKFPHEIGLFLDYPPDDVRGFIDNREAKKLSCPCYWKVYGNVEEAKKRFMKYKQAEYDAARLIISGR